MYLFIFESIGTQELALIAIVALIIFGPRKLPELAKMAGKAMNEFRRATNDFKSTWEREVNLESFDEVPDTSSNSILGNFQNTGALISGSSLAGTPESSATADSNLMSAEVKEVDKPHSISKGETTDKIIKSEKKDWL